MFLLYVLFVVRQGPRREKFSGGTKVDTGHQGVRLRVISPQKKKVFTPAKTLFSVIL